MSAASSYADTVERLVQILIGQPKKENCSKVPDFRLAQTGAPFVRYADVSHHCHAKGQRSRSLRAKNALSFRFGGLRSLLATTSAMALTLALSPLISAQATAKNASHHVGIHQSASHPAVAPSDVILDGFGDSSGYHLQVSRDGAAWRSIAVIRPAGLDPATWLGFQCLSGDGKYAAVVVLPESSVNLAAARDHGAFAYSVEVASGKIHPIASGVGLKYFSPGCGVGDDAVFTTNPGAGETSTVLTVADLATGAVKSSVAVSGQLTSTVSTASGLMGVAGSTLMSIGPDGKTRVVARLAGDGYELRPTADGGVNFLTTDGGASAMVHHEKAGIVSDLGSGVRTRLHLFSGRSGTSLLVGSTTTTRNLAAVGVKLVSDVNLADGATSASLDGSVVIGPTTGGSAQSGADRATAVVTSTGATSAIPRSNTADKSMAPISTTTVPRYVPRARAQPPSSTVRTKSSLRPGGDAKAAGPVPTSIAPATPADTGAPTCAVPRSDVTKQVMQPSPKQVDWAVQMAEQGLLTGAAYSRPTNWHNLGFPAYAPNTDFPSIPLSHPSGSTTTTVPRIVYEAIMAQESNFNQASWHAPSGNAGDPLIADYYGAAGDIVSINYPGADCGYGLGQVTDGMHVGDHVLSARGQVKVAVDYQDNIAAGLQILEQKWNDLYADGIIANNGDPKYLENWYFAAWAYNAGEQPGGHYNPTGCDPGPDCTGPHGTWGLGWTNNPDNLDYPPSRKPFLQLTYADAAHPSNWPYQERVIGWMGSPIIRYGTKAYAAPTFQGGKTWLQIPAFNSFCTLTDNNCDPVNTNPSNPGATHCMYDDFECWWHKPVTWAATCTTICATSPYAYTTGSTEPVYVTENPPTCTVDPEKVPAGAIIVDDEDSPPANLQGCNVPNWSQDGTFTMSPGTNQTGDPIGQIDIHQLGVGLGGHVWFSHTEDGSNPDLINTGTWTPNLPSLQYYKVKIHLPSIGATASNVVYTINPGGGANPWKIRVNQAFGSEEWATIGTFAMQNGGTVSLSNSSTVIQGSGQHAYDFDVAWDAVAFVPQGGTPGSPLGGPPTVQDEPKGSNPAWLQCGCATRTAGDPVDTSTGFFGDSFTDLSTPGRGIPLDFTRSYAGAIADPTGPNATAAKDGPFGYGWTFTYNMSATTDGSGNVTITQQDGSRVPFGVTAGIYKPSAPRYDGTLSKAATTYTYTLRGRELFTFDVASGRLLAETTLAGSHATPAYWTTLTYDAAGHLAAIKDPAGRKYTVTWTGNHITGLTDTAGRTVSYAYDTSGDLTDVYGVATNRTPTLQSNDRFSYTYVGGKHLLASMRTPKNYTAAGGLGAGATSMTYDTSDRVLTQTDPVGNVTTFNYGPSASPSLTAGQTLVTDPAGHKALHSYTNRLLTSETKGFGTADAGTWSYTYDPVTLGVSTQSDPNGNLQTFSYDDHGNRTSASNALGYTTLWKYDDIGEVIESVDPMGVATVNQYDQPDHLANPPVPGGFQVTSPSRVLDTRSGLGATGPVGAKATIAFAVTGISGIPASGVAAVMVNFTVVSPATTGNLVAYPSGTTRPLAANVSFTAGQTIAGTAIVPIGTDGKIQVQNYSTGDIQLVADIQGYYLSGPAADPGSFSTLAPTRILDTGTSLGASGPVGPSGSISVQVAGSGGVPASGASAVAVNLTVLSANASGNLTAYPDGATKPATSNLNFTTGQNIANLAIVPIGANGKIRIDEAGTGTVRIVGDIQGYFHAGTGTGNGTFTSIGPSRVLDTRHDLGAAGPVGPSGTIAVPVAGVGGVPQSGVTAVVADLLVVGPTAVGNIVAYADGDSQPPTSNLNYVTNQIIANDAVIPVGENGKIRIHHSGTGTVEVVADVQGFFTSVAADATSAKQYGDLTSSTVTQANNVVESATGNFGAAAKRTVNYFYSDAAHPADVTKVSDPAGHVTTASYDAFGNKTSTTDAENNTSKAGFDTGTGRVTSTVSSNGVAAGVIPGCVPPANGCTAITYNAFGEVTSATHPLGHVTMATYDLDGAQLTFTDANNRTVTTAYDLAGRPVKVTQADNSFSTVGYNLDSTVDHTVDGLGSTTSYGYDGQGRLTSSIDPDHRTSSIMVDKVGRMTGAKDALGRAVSRTLNPAGQITALTYSDGLTPAVSYGYDADGRRTSMTDASGTSSYVFDTFGELTSQTNGAGARIGYGYDPAGNVVSLAYPDQPVAVERGFDATNRLTSIKDFAGASTTFGYDHDSALTSTVYPNGVTVTNAFNNAEQLTETTATKAGTAVVSLGFGRDNTGQVSSQAIGGVSQAFGYSPKEQLASSTGGVTGSGGTATFAMDAADRPATVGAMTQTFDAAGQECWSASTAVATPSCGTVPAGATRYAFDGVGERTKTTPATGPASTFGYDQAGRLTSASSPSGSGTYAYNGDGLRTTKTVGGSSTSFTWDVSANLLSDGANRYLYGPGGLPIEQVGPAGTVFFVHDQVGSTRALLSSTGAVAGTYSYTPYGMATHSGTAATSLQYTGQYVDTESGLMYLRARYYDPATAQFMTIDPLVALTGTPYAYVGGNPTNGSDASGLCGFWCYVGIGIVGGAIVVATGGLAALAEGGLVFTATTGEVALGASQGAAFGATSALAQAAGQEALQANSSSGGGESVTGANDDQAAPVSGDQPDCPEDIGGGPSSPQLNRDVQFPGGGRGGGNVKNFVGPPNSVVRGATPGRVYRTDGEGRVISDITKERTKPVTPGEGFGNKMSPTSEEQSWIDQLWGG